MSENLRFHVSPFVWNRTFPTPISTNRSKSPLGGTDTQTSPGALILHYTDTVYSKADNKLSIVNFIWCKLQIQVGFTSPWDPSPRRVLDTKNQKQNSSIQSGHSALVSRALQFWNQLKKPRRVNRWWTQKHVEISKQQKPNCSRLKCLRRRWHHRPYRLGKMFT